VDYQLKKPACSCQRCHEKKVPLWFTHCKGNFAICLGCFLADDGKQRFACPVCGEEINLLVCRREPLDHATRLGHLLTNQLERKHNAVRQSPWGSGPGTDS